MQLIKKQIKQIKTNVCDIKTDYKFSKVIAKKLYAYITIIMQIIEQEE